MKEMNFTLNGVTYELKANSTWTKVTVMDHEDNLVAVVEVNPKWSDEQVRGAAKDATKRALTE